MNIEQILRNTIERKIAKILKEEYGIEMSKDVEGVIPTDTTSKHVYQVVLTERSGGVHREDIANIVEQIQGSKSYANLVRTINRPLVIARGLNRFGAVELKKSIVDKGGDCVIEKITKVNW